MKKFILAALAATVVASPVLADPGDHNDRGRYEHRYDNDRHDRGDRWDRHDRFDRREARAYRDWRRGERFDYRYARNYRVIDNPYYYRLRPAPRGYRWVQSGSDAVLIGITTGIVASVLAGAIH